MNKASVNRLFSRGAQLLPWMPILPVVGAVILVLAATLPTLLASS